MLFFPWGLSPYPWVPWWLALPTPLIIMLSDESAEGEGRKKSLNMWHLSIVRCKFSHHDWFQTTIGLTLVCKTIPEYLTIRSGKQYPLTGELHWSQCTSSVCGRGNFLWDINVNGGLLKSDGRISSPAGGRGEPWKQPSLPQPPSNPRRTELQALPRSLLWSSKGRNFS